MEARRSRYAAYSPVFWRPAAGARELHVAFLAAMVAADGVDAFRTENGLVIAQRRGNECFVDDFAVAGDERWPVEGRDLLLAAWGRQSAGGATTARVVTARLDEPKVALLLDVGLVVGEEWWVKPLTPPTAGDTSHLPIERPGLTAVKTAAPPVYDPGGPVMLVREVAGPDQLPALEATALEHGAVLAIVPAGPGDRALTAALAAAAYEVASQFYVGLPRR